jgi:hypothetical protein
MSVVNPPETRVYLTNSNVKISWLCPLNYPERDHTPWILLMAAIFESEPEKNTESDFSSILIVKMGP